MSDLRDKSFATLVAFTPNAAQIAMDAAAICYASVPKQFIIKFCIESGHESVLEHNAFTFKIQTSRVISQMFTRHRVASFSQRSQRYVVEDAFESIIPEDIEANPEWKERWQSFQWGVQQLYNMLVTGGVPAEQARMALTNGTVTEFYMTMNARELRHFFKLRLCHRAQKDISIIAWDMLRQVKEVAPLLFEDVTFPCLMSGFCDQGKMRCEKIKFPGTSKIMPTKSEVRVIVEMYMKGDNNGEN